MHLIATLHLIKLCHCELLLRGTRDSYSLLPLITVIRWQAMAEAHELASKAASHLITSLGCYGGNAFFSRQAVTDAMQFKDLTP